MNALVQPYFYTLNTDKEIKNNWRTFFALRITDIENIYIKDNDFNNERQFSNRLYLEQIDLINSLYQPDKIHSVEYRFRFIPERTQKIYQNIDIYIIISTEHSNKRKSLKQAAENFKSIFAVIQSSTQLYGIEPVSDEGCFSEIFNLSGKYKYIHEIRRRVSRFNHKTIIPKSKWGFVKGKTDDTKKSENKRPSIFLVHPFIPVNSRYEELLSFMSRMDMPVLVSIRVSPVKIRREENQYFNTSIKECEDITKRDFESHKLNKEQAGILAKILLSHYLSLQDAPFEMHVFIASARPTPPGVVELLGTEITRPVGGKYFDVPGESSELLSGYSGGHDVYSPKSLREKEALLSALMLHENNLLSSSLMEKQNEKRLQFLFDASEAACAFHLPISYNGRLPGVPIRWSKVRPIPSELLELYEANQKSGIIGVNNYLGIKNAFYLPEEARRRHVYIVGQTGTGKSSILKSMIIDDIKSGKGVGVFDPHGDLTDYILTSIPEERLDDVVLIDPSVKNYAVGVNILEHETIEQQNFIVQELIAMAVSIYDPGHTHGFAGPMFENISRMALYAIMSYTEKTPSFMDFPMFFYDSVFHNKVLHYLKKNRLKLNGDPFLDIGLESMTKDRDYDGMAGWVVSKYGRIVSDPSLRSILCQQKSTISFKEIMDDKKILLVNLNKAKIGSLSSEWLGMFLLTKIQAAAMRRVDIPEAKRNDFYLYIDEFQNSATQNFAEIFSESRKYRLNLTLANQYVAQIPEEIRSAIFGNVGTIVALRVGMEDATLLEGQFQPLFNKDDLIQLPNWKGFVASTATGKRLPPFTIETIPFETKKMRTKFELKRIKRKITANHGKKKTEIEKYLRKRVSVLMNK